jgi:uncharacterized membrane protein
VESRAKLFGHAIHPMLIVFPLGLLVSAVVFDIIYLTTGDGRFPAVAYWNIAAGIIGGLLAAVPGLIDWLAIPAGTRAKAVGLWHAIGNVLVLALFAVSWWIRRDTPAYAPDGAAFILAVAAVLLGTVTAWLGGELVERLHVGVEEGGHINSPSSLSGRPAEEQASPSVTRRDRAPV